jgi:secondary thiamine-phosphate synthase enzyme
MKTLLKDTSSSREIVDITEVIEDEIPEDFNGVVNIFIEHTTAALSLADLDPGTDQDILDALDAIIPDLDLRHPHDPSHAPDHIWSTIIGSSVQVPVENGNLTLGTWQRIILLEFNGPRDRNVAINLLTS